MKIHEIVDEAMTRRGFLQAMGAGAVAAAVPGVAQGAEWRSPKDFGYDKWEAEGKKIVARAQAILRKLISVAGQDAPKFANVKFSYAIVPGQAAAFGDGSIVFDPAIYYDLSDDTLAYVIGHEMGHIALGTTTGYKGVPVNVSRQRELDADVYGAKLAHNAGYNPNRAFADLGQAAKEARAKPKDTHPDYRTRVNNLKQKTGWSDVATIQDLEHNAQAIRNYAAASRTATA